MTDSLSLAGKAAIVTGSTRGIGHAIARRFAEAGAAVVISSRNQETCDAVAAELAGAGHRALAVACNVGRPADVEALVARTNDAFGRIDILVCNAATNLSFGPMGTATSDAFDKMISTNVKSVWSLCNLVLPQMAARKDGAAIVISSIAAIYGTATIGLYGMTKAAEAALVRNYAMEFGPANVRINAILPGLIKTDLSRALWEEPKDLQAQLDRTPLRRIGTPDDIAGLALLLASPAGSFITGQSIIADGGKTLG
jgi:NAD(P)-dependent dehydrogenase (short-subunit alcohol dehydrogenase family)